MSVQVYVNGQWLAKEDAKISVWDHGFLYGDGVFEGIRVYNGRIFKLEEHLTRLYSSARGIDLTIPMDLPKMRNTVAEAVRRNGLQDAYIRLVVSRGIGDLGIDPRKCSEATVVIIAYKIELYPDALYKNGIRVMVTDVRRVPPDALNGRIKSLNYLNNILGKMQHVKFGLDEALMLNRDGYLVEGTAENVFLVQGKKLLTPPCHLGALDGITRGTVMEFAPKLGLAVEEALLHPHDVYLSDECFLTGTGAEIVPVVEVDGRKIGGGVPGPITHRVLEAYRELTRREGFPVYPEGSVAKA